MSASNALQATTAAEIFVGGGQLAEAMKRVDWASSPLGPPEGWPQSLRSMVRILLTSRYQMWMAWGPELAFLYNDAYRPTMGIKHPRGLGHPTAEVWREIWDEIGPLIEDVLSTGVATYHERMLLLLERSGFREETYHTFSYSPLFDDNGAVSGLFCVVMEETERVINERRLGTLRALSSATTAIRTEPELFEAVRDRLSENLNDLPFTVTYLFDADGETARRVACSGIDGSHPAVPERLSLADSPWPVTDLFGSTPAAVFDLGRIGDLPSGAWDRAPARALIVPIAQPGQERAAAGFIVAGLNPYRAFDEAYADFVSMLARQIASALASVRAFEEERRRAQALEEIDRAKTTFFSNVSHEFRTPLTLMLAPLEDALAGPLSAAPEAREPIELAHRNGLRLLRLVNSLLDFSRIEAGRMKATFRPTDLAGYSAEIAATFRSAIEKAGLRLVLDTSELGEPVYVDRDMWEKILLNLLSNAFKFTFEGEVRLTARPAGNGREVLLQVADTGIGIPADELPRLFERFHRVEGARGRSFEGSGIGLALVQELVRLHGGTISVESEVGRGTVFTIRLPFGTDHLPRDHVREDDLQPDEDISAKAQPFVEEVLRWLPDGDAEAPPAGLGEILPVEGRPGLGKQVLVADDNPDMRDYVARLLRAQGYEVETVADGERALAAARERRPDLVLSDIMMPGIDGFGLLAALRADPEISDVPVILLSARAGEEAKIEGLEAGADDYLVKPFVARELLARVNTNIQMAGIREEAARRVMQSEQQYLMTQERLSRALSTGRVGVYDWRMDEDRLSVQGPLSEIFGVSVEDAARGLPLEVFMQGIHPDDRQRAAAAVQRTAETGQPFELEYRTHGAGEVRTVLSRGEILTGPSGERVFSGVLIDLTREKAAEQAIRESEAYLHDLVNSASEGVYAVDADGRTTLCNAAFRRMLGFSQEDQLIGRKLHDVIHHTRADGSAYSEAECPIYRAARTGEPAHVDEDFFFRADGTRFPVEYRVHPVHRDGRLEGAICIVNDSTERKLADERLRAHQAALEEHARVLTILNEAAVAVAGNLDVGQVVQAITDASVALTHAAFGAFFYNVVDEAGEHYTLYALSGAPREAFSRFPMPRNTQVFGPTFEGSGVVRSDDITKDPRYGRNTPYSGMPEGHLPVRSYLAAPVKSRTGEVLGGLFLGHPEVGVFTARSEQLLLGLASQAAVAIDNARLFRSAKEELAQRRRAEAELQAVNATLEQRVADEVAERIKAEEALRQVQKMEAIGQLTGGVAHDFNNLLTVIIGGLDTIRRAPAEDQARIRRAADLALQGAHRATSLTRRLLAFSRRQPLEPKPLDLNTLVRDMTDLLHRTLGETIELEGVLAPRLWTIEADQNQLEAAIINLAVNARDAMPDGGKLTVETANTALDESYSAIDAEVIPGQYVMVAVSDTGHGMSRETLARAFEPFFTTKEVGRGTGLGLSMVYGFVKQSGGHVTIYSEENHGTTVKLYFPRYLGEAAAELHVAERLVPRATPGEVILLVEDNEDVRSYSAMILEELGYVVLQAGDAEEALAVIGEAPRLDLLFTDVVLPGKNGRALADEGRQKRPGLPVLYTTGYSRNAIVHHGRLDPGVQLISKPFTFEELALRIRHVLDRV